MKKRSKTTHKRAASEAKRRGEFPGDAVTIGDLRALMREFVGEREWGKYHVPRNLAASVAVEAGELLELFQWWTDVGGSGGKRHW